VGVYVDGEQIPRKPLFLNFDVAGVQNVIASYQSLFSGIGKLYQDTGSQIDRSDYDSGSTILAFALTPDHCPRDHFELMKQGNLRLELHFSEALTNTVNLIICAEYQNVIEIDQTETFSATTQTKNGHQSAHAHFEERYIYKRCVMTHLPQTSCLQVFHITHCICRDGGRSGLNDLPSKTAQK